MSVRVCCVHTGVQVVTRIDRCNEDFSFVFEERLEKCFCFLMYNSLWVQQYQVVSRAFFFVRKKISLLADGRCVLEIRAVLAALTPYSRQ